MKWSIYIAKRITTAPKQSFSRFIIRLSIAATAISMAAMLVTLCLVNGFQKEISEKVFAFWGHIHVQSYSQGGALISEETPFKDTQNLQKIIATIPDVAHVQPYATKGAILKKNEIFSGIILKGIDQHFNWESFEPFIKAGNKINFNGEMYSRQIILSKKITDDLKVAVDDSILLYFLRGENNIQYRKVKVVGIYNTGIEEYDQNFVLADIRLLRKMNVWDSTEVGGYEIRVNDITALDSINSKIYDKLPEGLASVTIRKQYPNIFDWLDVQHKTKWIVISIMAVVAIINLITCLLIIVLERVKMVGLLQALGAGNRSIRQIFLYYSFYISILGIAFGTILGLGLCWAEYYFHFLKMDEATYYISYAPVAFNWLQISVIIGSTIATCFLALIIPSFIVSRIMPVKILQFQ